MIKIYKYELPIHGEVTIEKTQICRVLKIDNQYERPVMWCEINTEIDYRSIEIRVYMTNESVDFDNHRYRYAGSFALNSGTYIGHVYTTIRSVLSN